MAGDVLDPDRSRLADQQPEDSAPLRKRPDCSTLTRREPGCDELHEAAPLTDHAEGSVPGVRDLGRKIDDALKHHRERQLRREGEAGFEEGVLPIQRAAHRWRIYAMAEFHVRAAATVLRQTGHSTL